MTLRPLLAALALCLTASFAAAQTPVASHIRGTLTSIDGNALVIATREGPPAKVQMMGKVQVIAFKQVELSSIAPGSYVGTAARPGADGQLSRWRWWCSRKARAAAARATTTGTSRPARP